MAAGLGFKDFTTGEVLTAADVDGYLMQGVWVFASAAARDAAVTSPQEGNFAYLKDTNVTTYYTGSAWANLDTTGMTNPMTTTGDVIYSSSGSTPARLGIGTAGQVLQVNSGATAPEWATPAAGGGGLTFIKSQTIGSAVSSVTVTDAFSTTYDNYLITVIGGSASANNADINIKFGAATTGYKFTGIYMATTSATVNSYATDAGGNIACGGASANGMASNIYVFSPFLSARTAVISQTAPTHSDMFRQEYAGFLDDAVSYTSFIIAIASGTLTGGTIRVYGYQKS